MENTKFLQRLRGRIAQGVNILGCSILLSITGLVFVQVVLRKFFNAPLAWPEEMVRIFLVWASFLGAFVAMHQKKHLMLSVVVSRLTPVKRKVLKILTNVLILVVMGIFLIWGIEYIKIVGMIPMPTTGLANKYVYGVMWVSFLLMFFELLIQTIEIFLQSKNSDEYLGEEKC